MTDRGGGEHPDLPPRDVDELVTLLHTQDTRERVFESFPDAVLLTDVDGRIRDANRAALNLLGRRAEEVFGRPIDDVVVEDPGAGDDVSRLTRAGLWQGRVEIVRPDDSRVAVLARSLVLAGDDEPSHLLVLTERPTDPVAHALVGAEQRLAAIVDSASDAIIAVDRNQRIVVFNPGAETMFRTSATDAIGQPLERFIPERLRERHRQHIDGFATTGLTSRRMGAQLGTLTALRSDGEEFPIEATISRVEAPEGPLLTAIVRDVSERHRAEQERELLLAQERRAWAEARSTEERVRRLQAITDAALVHLALDDLFAELLGRLREHLHADSVTVLLLDREVGLLRVRATVGLERTADEMADVPFGMGVAGRIASDARPVVIEDLRRVPSVSPFLRRQLRSLVGVPIVHEGLVTGVLHVGTRFQRTFDDEDVSLLEIVASRLAPAIENARLHDAERAARMAAEADASRLRASRGITEALSRVQPLGETANAILGHIVSAVDAVAGAVGILNREDQRVEIVAAAGYAPAVVERFRTFALDSDLPLAHAVREATPVFLASSAERDESFPRLADVPTVGGSWAALPLLVDEAPIGVIGLTFGDPREFQMLDRDLMTTLAHQCAQALDRSMVRDREQRVLAEAEVARRRLALLQALTARLSGALTPDDVAEVVASAAVASGASSGALMLLDDGGSTFHVQAAAEQGHEQLDVWERLPVDAPSPLEEAVSSGRAVVFTSAAEMADRFPAAAASMPGSVAATLVVPVLASDRAIGAAVFGFPPGREMDPADRDLLSALGRHAGQALERARLYEDERRTRRDAERARERTERLQTVTEALADAETTAGVLDVLMDQGLGALGATAALVVELRGGDTLEVVAARGYPADLLAEWERFSVQDEVALAQAVRTQAGVWLASAEETSRMYPAVAEQVRRLGHSGAFAAIPLKVGDWVLGAIGLQFPDPRTWGAEDRQLLRAIARQCAQAWFRAQLHDAEAASRLELRRSERRYRSLVQATSAIEWTVDQAGAFVEPQPSWEAYTGQPWEEHQGFGWMNALHPEDRAEMSAMWFAARDARALFETEGRLWHAPSGEYHQAIARAAPVRDDRDRVIEWVGTIVDVHEQRLAERASQDRERASREDLQVASDRLALLADASEALTASLVVDETLQRLADMVVPRMADWCVVDKLDAEGTIDLVAVAHVDPAKAELARDLRRRYPVDPDAPMGAPNVLRTGRSELIPEIPQVLLEQAVEEHPELRELVHHLQLRSMMVVPLGIGGRSFGAITFVWAESGRTYSEQDLTLAEDLARRASVAVENARLYEAEQAARAEEAEAQQRLRILAEAGAVLAASLDQHVVVSAVSRLLARDLCDWSAAFLVGRDGRVVDAVGAHREPGLEAEVQRAITARFPDPNHPHSFVAHVVRTGETVAVAEVPQEQVEQVMVPGEQVEAVRRLGFSSVIAVPLSARGRTSGVLVAVRGAISPAFDDDDVELVQEVGRRTGLALENAQLYSEREYVAETLQRSLLPPDLPTIPGIEIGVRSLPASEGTRVGGDFYDVFEIDLDHWAAVIGDVVGKGAPAAAMMGLARYTIRTAAMQESRPSQILRTLNQAILRQTSDQRFCTACCLRLLRRDNDVRVTIASGGHPLPVIVRSDGSLETAGVPGTLLGVFEDATLEDRAIDLGRGDALVLYTDGVTDERNGTEEFGEVRLAQVLTSVAGRPAQEMADEILRTVVEFRSGEPKDDIAILVLRMTT